MFKDSGESDAISAFNSDYKTETREILVVLGNVWCGGVKQQEDIWQAGVTFLAWQDARTGEVKEGEGNIVWPTSEKNREKHGLAYPYFFESGTVYRLSVRELANSTVKEGRLPSFYNRFLVVKVLEKNAVSPELSAILDEYHKPVILNDEALGVFTLDKDLSFFCGKLSWCGNEIAVFLNVVENDELTWQSALAHLRSLVEQPEQKNSEFINFAAEELAELANDWQQDPDAEPITYEDFAQRIRLQELSVQYDGSYTAYYDDGDIFFGHVITINGSTSDGLSDVDIQG
jgi:hypothetical protein